MKLKMATHEGELKIGEVVYPVAVLDDGSRVLTRSGVLTLLDRPYKGQYAGELPAFVQAANLQPYVSEKAVSFLMMKSAAGWKYGSQSNLVGSGR